MTDNERILAEIDARMENARAELTDLSPILAPLLEYHDGQSVAGLAHEMMAQVSGSLAAWCEDDIQAGGFEWYYDGRDVPNALGYTYESIKFLPDLSKLGTIGSDTSAARDDFDGGVEFGPMIHSDTAGLDVGNACFPVYECDVAELGNDEEYDDRAALVNLFTLRLFKCLHLAFRHLAATGAMQKSNLKKPACFFANNHDWSPFLVFVYDENQTYEPLTETGPTRVEHLQGWLDKIKEGEKEKEQRDDFLSSVVRSAPEHLERNLLGMPVLTHPDGNTMEFSREELKRFGWSQLSDPEICRTISFDAFTHYVRYALDYEGADTYVLQVPLTCLFVRDPKRAYSFIKNLIDEQPDTKDLFHACINNYLRWSSDIGMETRWANPSLALHNSPEAIASMQKVQAL